MARAGFGLAGVRLRRPGFRQGGWISVSLGSLKFPRDSRLDGED